MKFILLITFFIQYVILLVACEKSEDKAFLGNSNTNKMKTSTNTDTQEIKKLNTKKSEVKIIVR
jgi:hypothetical protein